MVDNPIYESADQYQNVQTRLHPHTLNTAAEAEQSSIYSVVADERRMTDVEECQKSVLESARNVSIDEDSEERYEEERYATVLGQASTSAGCTDSNKY